MTLHSTTIIHILICHKIPLVLMSHLMKAQVTPNSQTSECCQCQLPTMPDNQYEGWCELTVPELRAYFGFCILMGIVKLPSLDDYWKKDLHLHYDPVASRITRDRFRDIRRYLHFVDNDTLPPPGTPGSDRLAKVRPLFEAVNSKCRTLYQPHRDVAVDEAMLKFQGRSSLKQYFPLKPVKRGLKVWVLADSTNGYFWNMQVYTGKEKAVRGV